MAKTSATGTTVSGTVGAALEAAAFGIPGLALSLQTPKAITSLIPAISTSLVQSISLTIFAKILLAKNMPEDVDVLKVEIPDNADRDTPWCITRVGHNPYYHLRLKNGNIGMNRSRSNM